MGYRLLDDDFTIIGVKGRWILDSRGNPTVEVEVVTRGGGVGRAAAPAGASKGKHEAVELRDSDSARFRGKGVERAVFNVNNIIAPSLIGLNSRLQRLVDSVMCKLDGTPNKSRLGANAIVATSIANAKAAAATAGLPLYAYLSGGGTIVLPTPLLNIINGGAHAGNELSFQEFMIVPLNADSFAEALRMASEVYHYLRDILVEKYGKTAINVGDEGGFAPPMRANREALDALMEAIARAGYGAGDDIGLALDAAASHFYDEKRNVYVVDGAEFSADELIEYYLNLVDEYPIMSIEDPFHEEDFESHSKLTEKIGSRVLIVGDDLYVTNISRLARGLEMKATNALLMKVNQVGTLTEAVDITRAAHRNGIRVIVSHRSGETEDTAISHIAVGLATGFIKTGAPARGERTAKYNELLRIEEEAAGASLYAGRHAYRGLVTLFQQHPLT